MGTGKIKGSSRSDQSEAFSILQPQHANKQPGLMMT